MKWFISQTKLLLFHFKKFHLIHPISHLQCLEDGPAVRGQLGVGGLAEELREGGDGVQFVSWNLERKKKWHQTKYKLTTVILIPAFKQSVCLFLLFLTSENLPSPNHCSHLMPWLACRLPVARHVTTMPGHQEKPLIFPHTSSPMPKPLLSLVEKGEERKCHCLVLCASSQKMSHDTFCFWDTGKVWGMEKRIWGQTVTLLIWRFLGTSSFPWYCSCWGQRGETRTLWQKNLLILLPWWKEHEWAAEERKN